MGLFDYFKILKALIILFLLHICLLELFSKSQWEGSGKTLADSNSDAVKTTLTVYLRYFNITLPLFQVLQKSLPIPLSLCHIK